METQEIREFVESEKCMNCGMTVMALEWYQHDGGQEVEDIKGKQWFYGHCGNCGYDSSLVKLVNRAKSEKDMGMR